ncbi:MAG: phosphoribosylformylglycinamidine synthase subunit PurS [Gemmatimonadetes bacterium]|nr:phosphoribosylformylglycinamidine synthase subunit PurS [Gemmatimonadota bacterium]
MSQYRLEVRVKPRPGLLDPQGKAIHHSLNSLGWDGVADVRVGKAIYIDLEAESAESAIAAAEEMCRKLLANPVTEDFAVALEQEAAAS